MTTGGPADQHGNGYPAFQGDQSPYYGQQSDGYQQGFPGSGYSGGGYPAPERSPWASPVVLVAAAAGVLLVVGGILAAVLLIPSGDDDDPIATPGTSITTHTVTSSQDGQSTQPVGTQTVTLTPPPGTTTTVTDRPSPTVPGADWQGFTDGPRCDAANDPAVAILRTARSRVIICQVGSAGGRYYKGVAPEGHKHIDFPTQQGKYFIARSGSYEYFVTPSGLVIRDGGNTIADEPATAYWSR